MANRNLNIGKLTYLAGILDALLDGITRHMAFDKCSLLTNSTQWGRFVQNGHYKGPNQAYLGYFFWKPYLGNLHVYWDQTWYRD